MDINAFEKDGKDMSFGEVARELGTAMKNMVQSEIQLVTAELKTTSQQTGKYAMQAGIFAALMVLSALPFLAFLVIGLGRLLEDNYWLSSLIVAVVCALVGGLMARHYFNKMKEREFMPRTRESLDRTKGSVSEKLDEVKDVANKEVAKVKKSAKRRAA